MKEQGSQLAKSTAVVQYVSESIIYIYRRTEVQNKTIARETDKYNYFTQVAWVLNINDFSKLTKSYNRFTGNCFCLSGSSGLIEQTSLRIPTYWFDFKKSSMNFNSIIIPRKARVNTSVFSFSAVDIQSVFFHFTASLRERFCRRSCPCYLRDWVSKEITLYLCFLTQKSSHFSWRRLGKSRCTCKVK